MSEVKHSNKGYTLVGLFIAMSFMAVAVLVALPLWSTAMKREREKELIFRGRQYTIAVSEYRMKNGRLPTSLDDLIKSKPRFIRQLWKDPITGENDWVLIHPGDVQPGGQQGIPGLSDGEEESGDTGEGEGPGDSDDSDDSGGFGLPGGGRTTGPIIGVASKSKAESIMVYNDKTHYNEWVFTIEDLRRERAALINAIRTGTPGGPGGRRGPGGVPPGSGSGMPGGGRRPGGMGKK